MTSKYRGVYRKWLMAARSSVAQNGQVFRLMEPQLQIVEVFGFEHAEACCLVL